MENRDSTNINTGQMMPLEKKGVKENLLLGIIAGSVAAIIGAIIWGLITYWTQYQIGWMAIGVGFLVGFAIRLTGKGNSTIFGIAGAILAVLGCLAGNVLATCFWAAKEYNVPIFEVLSIIDFQAITEILQETFSPIDLLFYALAIYAGYKFSFIKAPQPKVVASSIDRGSA